jgi:hypothetical protein
MKGKSLGLGTPWLLVEQVGYVCLDALRKCGMVDERLVYKPPTAGSQSDVILECKMDRFSF